MHDNKSVIRGLERTIDEAIYIINHADWRSDPELCALAVRAKLREARPIDWHTAEVTTNTLGMQAKAGDAHRN